MNLDRPNYGEMIAGISAILLFVFMFFDWYRVNVSAGISPVPSENAWEALAYTPLVLVIAVAAAVGLVALRLIHPAYEPHARANAVVAVLGVVSSLLILLRILAPPPPFNAFREVLGSSTVEGTVQLPIFLTLAAAVGVAFDGCWAMRQKIGSLDDLVGRRQRASPNL